MINNDEKERKFKRRGKEIKIKGEELTSETSDPSLQRRKIGECFRTRRV